MSVQRWFWIKSGRGRRLFEERGALGVSWFSGVGWVIAAASWRRVKMDVWVDGTGFQGGDESEQGCGDGSTATCGSSNCGFPTCESLLGDFQTRMTRQDTHSCPMGVE